MAFQLKKALRENVNLIVCVAGGTGSGKSFSAMRIAKGICGEKSFVVLDTENGRALHYADQFNFMHGEIRAPFSPEAYTEAILAADKEGFPAIVVDSMSHEHAGEGGLLDMHDADVDRMAGQDWKRREAVNMVAWVRAKGEHKRMVQKLLQVKAHLILCFRAEEKIEVVKDAEGKVKIIPKRTTTGLDGWVPICEKNLPYEATCSFLLLATAPGVPHPIKLQEQHKAFFQLDKPISEGCGKRIAAWAAGKQLAAPAQQAVGGEL